MSKAPAFFLTLAAVLAALALAAGCGSNSPTTPSAPVTIQQLPPTATPTPTWTPGGFPGPTWTFTATNSPTFTPTPTSTWTPVLIVVTYTSTPTITATTCSNHGVTDQVGNSTLSAAHYYTDQFTVSQTTLLTSLSFYGADVNSTPETGYLALYAAASGNLTASVTFSLQSSDGYNYFTFPVAPVTLPSGNYNLVILDPTGTVQLTLGQSNTTAHFDYGTYAGGTPPANYSTLFAGSTFGGFLSITSPTLYFSACP